MPQPQPQQQRQRQRRSPSVDSRGGSSAASSNSISISSMARRSGRPLVGRTGAARSTSSTGGGGGRRAGVRPRGEGGPPVASFRTDNSGGGGGGGSGGGGSMNREVSDLSLLEFGTYIDSAAAAAAAAAAGAGTGRKGEETKKGREYGHDGYDGSSRRSIQRHNTTTATNRNRGGSRGRGATAGVSRGAAKRRGSDQSRGGRQRPHRPPPMRPDGRTTPTLLRPTPTRDLSGIALETALVRDAAFASAFGLGQAQVVPSDSDSHLDSNMGSMLGSHLGSSQLGSHLGTGSSKASGSHLGSSRAGSDLYGSSVTGSTPSGMGPGGVGAGRPQMRGGMAAARRMAQRRHRRVPAQARTDAQLAAGSNVGGAAVGGGNTAGNTAGSPVTNTHNTSPIATAADNNTAGYRTTEEARYAGSLRQRLAAVRAESARRLAERSQRSLGSDRSTAAAGSRGGGNGTGPPPSPRQQQTQQPLQGSAPNRPGRMRANTSTSRRRLSGDRDNRSLTSIGPNANAKRASSGEASISSSSLRRGGGGGGGGTTGSSRTPSLDEMRARRNESVRHQRSSSGAGHGGGTASASALGGEYSASDLSYGTGADDTVNIVDRWERRRAMMMMENGGEDAEGGQDDGGGGGAGGGGGGDDDAYHRQASASSFNTGADDTVDMVARWERRMEAAGKEEEKSMLEYNEGGYDNDGPSPRSSPNKRRARRRMSHDDDQRQYDAVMDEARQTGRKPTPDPRRRAGGVAGGGGGTSGEESYDRSMQSFGESSWSRSYNDSQPSSYNRGSSSSRGRGSGGNGSLNDRHNYYQEQQRRMDKEANENRASMDGIGEIFPRWDSYSVRSDPKQPGGRGGSPNRRRDDGSSRQPNEANGDHRPWRQSNTEPGRGRANGDRLNELPDHDEQLDRIRADGYDAQSRASLESIPAWQRVEMQKERDRQERQRRSSMASGSLTSGPETNRTRDTYAIIESDGDDASDIAALLRRKSIAAGYSPDELEKRAEERRKRKEEQRVLTKEEARAELEKIWGMESKARQKAPKGTYSSDIAQAVAESTRDLSQLGRSSKKRKKSKSKSSKSKTKKKSDGTKSKAEATSDREAKALARGDQNLRSLKSYLEPVAQGQPKTMDASGYLSEGSRRSIRSVTSKKGTKRFRVDEYYESAPIPPRAVDLLAGLAIVDAEQEGEVGPGILQRAAIVDRVVASLCGEGLGADRGEIVWSDDDDGLDEDAMGGVVLTAEKSTECPNGIGKSCIAALVAAHETTIEHFNGGIAWIDLGDNTATDVSDDPSSATSLTFVTYKAHLESLCHQLEVVPPDFDALCPPSALPTDPIELIRQSELRAMEDAKKAMYRLIKKRKALIIIDGVQSENVADIAFFRFARIGGRNISRVLVATSGDWSNESLIEHVSSIFDVVQVPILREDEAADLLLSTIDPDSGDVIQKSDLRAEAAALAEEIVELCSFHPLVVGAVSNWLGLKAATVGHNKALAEIAEDLTDCVELAEIAMFESGRSNDSGDGNSGGQGSKDQISAVYENILLKTLAPSVKGRPSMVVQLCFAAFVQVFSLHGDGRGFEPTIRQMDKFDAKRGVPMDIVSLLWSSLLGLHHADVFGTDEEPYSLEERKDHVSFIVEALCSLGVLHRRETAEQDGSVSISLSYAHDMQRRHAANLVSPSGALGHISEDCEQEWNRALVEACSTADIEGRAATAYFQTNIVSHMIRANMFLETISILQDEDFMVERLQTDPRYENGVGLVMGTKRYVQDIQSVIFRLTEDQAVNADSDDIDIVQVTLDCYWILEEAIRREVKDAEALQPQTNEEDDMKRPVAFYAAHALYLIGASLASHHLFEHARNYYQSALDSLDAAATLSDAKLSNESWLYALSLHRLSAVHLEMTDTEASLKLLGRSLPLLEKRYSRRHVCFVRALSTMGIALFESCRYDAALSCLRNVVTVLEHDENKRKEGKDSSQRELIASFKGTNGIIIADSLEMMGRIAYQQGEYENALDSFQDALLRKENELGDEHYSLYSLHREIAMCKEAIGDTDGAAQSFDYGIALLMNAARRGKRTITDFTAEEENHIHLHLTRGQNHQLSYDIRKAMTSLRTALGTALKPRLDISKFRDRCRQGREVVATILHFLALSYVAMEEDDQQSVSPDTEEEHENGLQAVKYFEKSLAWLSPRCRKHGLNAANTWYHQGNILGLLQKNDEALEALAASLSIRRDQLGECDLVAVTLEAIGDIHSNIYRELGDDSAAANTADEHYLESINIREQIFGEHSSIADVLFKRSQLKMQLGNIDEAIALLERCHAMRKTELGEQHPLVALTLYRLGCSQLEHGDKEAAALSFEKIVVTRAFESVDSSMDGIGEDGVDLPAAFVLAGQTLAKVEKLETAEECFDEAIRIKSQTLGEGIALADFVEEIGTFFKDQRLEEESWAYFDRADAIRKRLPQDSNDDDEDDAISYHSYGNEELADRSNKSLRSTLSDVDEMPPVMEHDEIVNDGEGSELDEKEDVEVESHGQQHEKQDYDENYQHPPNDSEGKNFDLDKSDRRSSDIDDDQDMLQSAQGLVLQDSPQKILPDEVSDSGDAGVATEHVQESPAVPTSSEPDGGAGVGMAVAAAAAGGMAAIGTMFAKNDSNDKVKQWENDSQFEDHGSGESYPQGSVEMDDMTNPTLNPEIRRLYEDGVITQAEYDQMKQADRQFRHGPISVADVEPDEISDNAERATNDSTQHEDYSATREEAVPGVAVATVDSDEDIGTATKDSSNEAVGPIKDDDIKEDSGISKEDSGISKEESITNEFYGSGSAGEANWESQRVERKQVEAPTEPLVEKVEVEAYSDDASSEKRPRDSSGRDGEPGQDSASITSEFYTGGEGTEEPAAWQSKAPPHDDDNYQDYSNKEPSRALEENSLRSASPLLERDPVHGSTGCTSLDDYGESVMSLDNTIMAEEAVKLRKELEMELDQESSNDDKSAHDFDAEAVEPNTFDRSIDYDAEVGDKPEPSEDYDDNAAIEGDIEETNPAQTNAGQNLGRYLQETRPGYDQSLGTLMESQSEWSNSQSTMGSNEKKEAQEFRKLANEPAPIVEEEDEAEEDGEYGDDYQGVTSSGVATSATSLVDLDLSEFETSDLFVEGEKYLKMGSIAQACLCFDKLIADQKERFGDSDYKIIAQEIFDIACKFLDCGYSKEAISYFQAILAPRKDISIQKDMDVKERLLRVGSAFLVLNDEGRDSGVECMQEMLRLYMQSATDADKVDQLDTFFHDKGSELSTIGYIDEALLCYEFTIGVWDKQQGRDVDRAVLRGEMAELYDELENADDAINCYLECIEIKELLGQDSTNELERLGLIYNQVGDSQKAAECLEEALKAKEAADEDTAELLVKLVSIYAEAERTEEAIDSVYKCIAAMKYEGDEDGLASMLDTLGSLHLAQDNLDDATAAFEDEVALLIKTTGEESDAVAAASYRLGSIYMEQGNHEKSLEHFERVASIRAALLGEVHPQVADTYYIMASISLDQGDNDNTLRCFDKVVEIRRQTLGKNHLEVADNLFTMASLCVEIGKIEKGLKAFDEVVQIRRNRFGHDHPETAESLHSVGMILLNMNYADESLAYFRAVAELRRSQIMPKDEKADVGAFLYRMGEHLLKDDISRGGQEDDLNNVDVALQCFDQVLMLRKQPLNPDYASTGDFLANLASLFHEKGRKEESLECLSQCALIQKEQYGLNSAEVGDTAYLQGRVCMEIGDTKGALRHLNDALAIREDLGEDTSDIISQLDSLEKEAAENERAGSGAGANASEDGLSGTDSEWISKADDNDDYLSEEDMADFDRRDQLRQGDESSNRDIPADACLPTGSERASNVAPYGSEKYEEEDEEENAYGSSLDGEDEVDEVNYRSGPSDHRAYETDDDPLQQTDHEQDGQRSTARLEGQHQFSSHSSYSQELDGDDDLQGMDRDARATPTSVISTVSTDDRGSRAGGNEEEINDPIANLISDAGEVLADGDLREEADECFDMAMDIRKRYIAERDPELHDFLQKIGDAALEIEALGTALECFEEESILRRKYGRDDEALADALHAFGSVLLDLGDNERAMEAFLGEVDIRTKCLGPEDLIVAEVLDTIGALHLESGDHVAALESFSQVAKIQKIHLGTDHEDVAETLYSIGLILLSLNDHEEALVAFREVVEIRKQTFGLMDEAVGDALNITGFLEMKSGNKEQALRFLSKALDIRRHNEEWAKAADTLQQIGDIHREAQNFDLAIDCYKECLKLSSMELGDEDEGIADGYIALGNIQTVVGQHADASASYQAALFIIMRVFGDEDERVMPLLLKMGTSRLRAGDTDQAEQNLDQFARLRKTWGENNDIDYVNALRIIGQIRMAEGNEKGAMEVWEEAFDTYTNNRLAYDHPRVGEKLRNLLDGADDDEDEGPGIAALFNTLRKKSSVMDSTDISRSAEDIVNQATFFSTKDIDNKSFQSSSRSLMSSMRDTHSLRGGGDDYSITSRSITSRSSRYSRYSRARRSRRSSRNFFDERSVDGSLEQGIGRAYMR